MIKAIIIFVIVLAVLIGGLLTLRASSRAGQPSAAVLERAAKRGHEQDAADDETTPTGKPPG